MNSTFAIYTGKGPREAESIPVWIAQARSAGALLGTQKSSQFSRAELLCTCPHSARATYLLCTQRNKSTDSQVTSVHRNYVYFLWSFGTTGADQSSWYCGPYFSTLCRTWGDTWIFRFSPDSCLNIPTMPECGSCTV